MKHMGRLWRKHWKKVLIGFGVGLFAYLVLFHSIPLAAPRFSSSELTTYYESSSLESIWHNPLNAPFKLVVWAVRTLGIHSAFVPRYVAATCALLAAYLFYTIVVHLFSRRIALLSSLMFIFSTGFLQTSHLGTALILQLLGVVLLMAFVPYYSRTPRKVAPIYICAICLALLCYVPAMPWMLVAGAVILKKLMSNSIRHLKIIHRILLPVLLAVLLVPLVWSIVQTPSSGLNFLGFPSQLPSLGQIGTNVYELTKSLVWKGTGPASIMLVGAPIMNVIEIGLVATGLVVLIRSFKLMSNLFIVSGLLLFTVLVFVGGITYIPLTPIFALLLANGLYYLLTEWFDIFPINPIANIVGTTAIMLLVICSVLFHTRSYYVAWSHNDATYHEFSHQISTKQIIVPSNSSGLKF